MNNTPIIPTATSSIATRQGILIAIIVFLITFPTLLKAQDEAPWPQPGKESAAYHVYRQKMTVPPYGFQKVQALSAGSTTDDMDNMVADPKAYERLSLREKFAYHVTHGEAYNQNCDVQPPIVEEDKKIFGQLPDFLGDNGWSQRQEKFFLNNRDTVLALIRESTIRSKHMGVNYKQVIVDVKAVELIPFVIKTYRDNPKDKDLLTVLLLLMKDANYAPFLQTPTYKKLYGGQSDYRSFLVFNAANEALIISRALDFYNSRKR